VYLLGGLTAGKRRGQPDKLMQSAALLRQALWLEYLTLAWMIVEAAVGIGAGVAAGSLVLTAFGIDASSSLPRLAC
jgi:hypothetical protein